MIKHGNVPNKDTDMVKKAQEIIDNFVMMQIKKPSAVSKVDMFLWISAGLSAALTLTLYLLAK